MAFELPYSKVLSDMGPGGGITTAVRGANALTKENIENQIKNAQAQYAPYQAYGNAFLTNQEAQWTPYKYQMQAMSNPLLWMAAQSNPALKSQLSNMFSNPSIPQGGGVNIPLPNQNNTSPFGRIFGGIFRQQTPSNPMQQPNNPNQNVGTNGTGADSGYSYDSQNKNVTLNPQQVSDIANRAQSNLPTAGTNTNQPDQNNPPLAPPTSPEGQVGAQATTPYRQLPVKPGVNMRTNTGEVISPPTEGTVDQIQKSTLSLQNVVPLLDNIAERGRKLLSSGELRSVRVSSLINRLDQYGISPPEWAINAIAKTFGIDRNAVGEFAKWNADRKKAGEGLMGGLSLPSNEMSLGDVHTMVDPADGESGEDYYKRIMQEKSYLMNVRLPQYTRTLAEGQHVAGPVSSNQAPSSPAQATSQPMPQSTQKPANPASNKQVKLGPDEWIVYDFQKKPIGIGTTAQTDKLLKDYKGFTRSKS